MNTPTVTEPTPAPDDFNEYVAWRAASEPAEAKPAEAAKEKPSEAAPAKTDEPGEQAKSAEGSDPANDTEQELTEDKTDGETPDEQADPSGKKKGRGYQRKIDKLTRKNRELEEQLAKATEGQPPVEKTAKPADAASGDPAGKPKVDDFDTFEEFTEALVDWKKAESDRESAEAEDAKTQAKEWQGKLTDAKSRHKDFDEVLTETGDIEVSPAIQQVVLESTIGGDLLYYLAANPEEAERLSKLAPLTAARELGAIEATLSKEIEGKKAEATAPPNPKPKLTAAPPPITPVRGSAPSSLPSTTDETLAGDYNAWETVRNADIKRKQSG